jgi:hypothetical protein
MTGTLPDVDGATADGDGAVGVFELVLGEAVFGVPPGLVVTFGNFGAFDAAVTAMDGASSGSALGIAEGACVGPMFRTVAINFSR